MLLVFGGAADVGPGDLVGVADVGGEERFVAEGVDEAGDAVGAAGDGAEGGEGEIGQGSGGGGGEVYGFWFTVCG